MAYLRDYIIHCSDTPMGMRVTKEMLEVWHMGPKKLDDGRIKYLGDLYPSIRDTPLKPIHEGQWGNGWDRYGYEEIHHRDGTKTILTNVDDDQYISSDEMTWGAAGVNSGAVHVCLEGGRLENGSRATKLMQFHELFTDEQWFFLRGDITNFISKHPQVKVSGHNKYSKKLCPGFDVVETIGLMGLKGYSKF